MRLLFLEQWLPGEVLRAIGWTLIHSLWQGLLAAVIAGVIIVMTKRSAARLRYNLLGWVLILFITTAGITFTQELKNAVAAGKTFAETNIDVTETFLPAGNDEAISPAALTTLDRFVAYVNTNAGIFVLIWAIFFFVHCTKLIGGLAGIQRIKNYQTHSSPEVWMEKLDHLTHLIGVKKPVRLFQSQLVKVPVAIGFFKPVILVPLGLLSNLPPEQAETILLHELAHIRRNDYLVNIFQRFAEAVFFFNPALLWISSLLRQEREACCDDIVVANTNSKGNYLEALVSFQEYSLASQGYALAITSKRHYLLNRVRRMITRENKKLNVMEKIVLIMGLVAFTAFSFIPKKEPGSKKKDTAIVMVAPVQQVEVPRQATANISSKPPRKYVVKKENKKPVLDVPVMVDPTDTVPGKKEKQKTSYYELKFPSISSSISDDGKTKSETTTVTNQDGKKYTFTKLNNKVTSLIIDGKTIPENEYDNYSQLFGQVEKTREENKARRLLNTEQRKANLMQRREYLKNRTTEKTSQREYQNAQKKYLLEQNRYSKSIEKSRRTSENQRKAMMRILEKTRKQRRNVPMLNGREIIKNENQVDNSIAANIVVKTDVNNVAEVSQNIKDIERATDLTYNQEIRLKSSPDVALKFETNINLNTNLRKKFNYMPGIEKKTN